MNFIMLMNVKLLKIKSFLTFKSSDVEFIMLTNVKMPIIVGIHEHDTYRAQ